MDAWFDILNLCPMRSFGIMWHFVRERSLLVIRRLAVNIQITMTSLFDLVGISESLDVLLGIDGQFNHLSLCVKIGTWYEVELSLLSLHNAETGQLSMYY